MRVKISSTVNLLIKNKMILFLITGLILTSGYSGIAGESASGGRKYTVNKGDKVKVEYIVSLPGGTVFDKSKPGRPLIFTVGNDQMPPGLEHAVLGMELRERKKVTVKPEDAYGQRNEELVMSFIKSDLPRSFVPEIGMSVKIQDIPGTIVKIDEDYVFLDGNHPLAGKDVVFDIKVLGIE